MKKFLISIAAVMLCICSVLGLAACGGNQSATDNAPEAPVTGVANILVAYFSWSGNTQQVARWISEKTEGEIFRIVPEVPYTNEDVFDRAQNELNSGTRPPLAEHIDEDIMAEYDVIFVGFPIGGTTCQCWYGHFWKNTTCLAKQLFRFLHTTAVQAVRVVYQL